MALQIGRAGRTLVLPEPTDWQNAGPRSGTAGDTALWATSTVTGGFQISPITDAIRLRDQLLGYVSNFDEEVVPVMSDAQPRDNGYYKVTSCDITTVADTLTTGYVKYQIDLEPVPGYSLPMFESIITGGLLNNAVGAVAGDMVFFHAFPGTAGGTLEYFKGAVPSSFYNRTSADGNVGITLAGTVSDTAKFYIAPIAYYTGAALIEQGTVLQPVVGRQMMQADTSFRLSNGLVRVTPGVGAHLLDLSFYTGAAWTGLKGFDLFGSTGGLTYSGIETITVLRNSPEEAAIRLGLAPSLVTIPYIGGRVFLDLSLRRGDRMVRGYVTADATEKWQIRRNVAEAATAITYGAVTAGNVRATANDADAVRYVMMSVQAATVSDLVNGRLTLSVTGTTFDFALGVETPGGTAVLPDRAVDIAQQYIAAQTEKMQVVVR